VKSHSKLEDVFNALRTAEDEAALPHGVGDGSPERIARDAGIAAPNVRRNLKILKADDRAHIFCWTDANPRSPVWVVGPGKDAPKPDPIPKSEHRRRHRERNKNRVRTEIVPGAARQLTYECIERARQVPQPWFAALMGVA
jgi:hypothetical protein